MKLLTGISRILVGCLFIFSGFIKANDPVGFSYKLTEYYEVFGTGFLQFGEVWQAILICVAEIVLGFCVLIGTRMRLTSWLLLLMILFFTLLTGFTAVTNWFHDNPDSGITQWFASLFGFNAKELYYMKDCGCFGDAIKLTPWQSFYKDLILTGLILIIFIRRKHIRPFFAKILQTNIIILFTLLSAFFSISCYLYTPWINFLYWQNGNNVWELMQEVPAEKEYVFIYEKDGVQHEFKTSELPENISEYSYVDRKEIVIKPGKPAKIHDFYMNDQFGNDITQAILTDTSFKLFIIAYDLEESRTKSFEKFRETAVAFQEAGYPIYAFTNNDAKSTEEFRHEHQLAIPFHQMDRTALKSIIRSNPGYILLRGPVVVDQWSSRSTPDMDKLEKVIKKYRKKEAKKQNES